jgi:hypothetical protein
VPVANFTLARETRYLGVRISFFLSIGNITSTFPATENNGTGDEQF